MGGCKSGAASLFATKVAPAGGVRRWKRMRTKIRRVDWFVLVRRKRKPNNLSLFLSRAERGKKRENATEGKKETQGSEIQVGKENSAGMGAAMVLLEIDASTRRSNTDTMSSQAGSRREYGPISVRGRMGRRSHAQNYGNAFPGKRCSRGRKRLTKGGAKSRLGSDVTQGGFPLG